MRGEGPIPRSDQNPIPWASKCQVVLCEGCLIFSAKRPSWVGSHEVKFVSVGRTYANSIGHK